ncbi:MAG: AbrB/MazE/SpoVT family DNA-binding domain-containing protein [Candidatus Sabulitectum sp.]|nr:AbrB/MazE/SpoVT family DNA-binding domain-containing protein [Candidatus Sabulitectum sp.]
MIKRLRKVGNSNALILDKPILELLGLKENGLVQLKIQGSNLIITPSQPSKLDADTLSEQLSDVINRRSDLLKRLAE